MESNLLELFTEVSQIYVHMNANSIFGLEYHWTNDISLLILYCLNNTCIWKKQNHLFLYMKWKLFCAQFLYT